MLGSIASRASVSRARGWSAAAVFIVWLCFGTCVAVLLLFAGRPLTGGDIGKFIVAAGLAAATALSVLQLIGFRPVQSGWQVPEAWRQSVEPELLPAFYGILLGLGFLNAVVMSGYWVLVLASLIAPAGAVVLGWVGYAIVRAVGFWYLLNHGRAHMERRLSTKPLVFASAAMCLPLSWVLLTATLGQ